MGLEANNPVITAGNNRVVDKVEKVLVASTTQTKTFPTQVSQLLTATACPGSNVIQRRSSAATRATPLLCNTIGFSRAVSGLGFGVNY